MFATRRCNHMRMVPRERLFLDYCHRFLKRRKMSCICLSAMHSFKVRVISQITYRFIIRRSEICKTCGIEYGSRNALKRYLSQYHRSDIKYSCDFCNCRTEDIRYFQDHRQNTHGQEIDGFNLDHPYCSKTITNNKDWEKHVIDCGKRKTLFC